MSARVADWRLKIGFGGGIGGPFRFGKSAFSGPDVFAKTFAGFFNGPYDDVTDDIAEGSDVTWSRGLDAKLQSLVSGQIKFTLIRPGQISWYDPNDPTSPLFTSDPGFVPMRPVQLQAIADGTAAAPLTVSGNEVTDATRAAASGLGTTASGNMCDGLTNDSSFGIRRAATNLHRHGQNDALGTDVFGVGGPSVGVPTVDPTVAFPFSPNSFKVACDGTNASQGVVGTCAAGQAAAAGVFMVGSAYFKGQAGQSYAVQCEWLNTDGTTTAGATTTFNATGAVQLLIPAAVAVAAGKTGDALRVRVRINGTRNENFWVGHFMLEKGQSVVAPYVATSGGVTATHAAGRVQAPATLLNATQGWVAMRIRMGYANDAALTQNNVFLNWADSTNERIVLDYMRTPTKQWRLARVNGGTFQSVTSAAQTFLAGDIVTLVCKWDAAKLYVSVNGGAFVSANAALSPTLVAALVDIGSAGAGALVSDCDFLWTACGTGTLTDSDAKFINDELVAGREPYPGDINDFDAAAVCRAAWFANDATYLVPGVTYGEFYGFIRDASYDPETGRCQILAEDLFLWMSRVKNPVISSMAGVTSSAAVGALLDSFDFSDPALRVLTSLPQISGITFVADGTRTALDLLKGLIDAEQGVAFIDRSGVFHFEDRYARERRRSATVSFSTELFDIDSRASADSIGNRVTITPATNNAQVAENAASEITYGIGDIASISTGYLDTDAKGASLAALILKRRKDPHPPQYGTVFNDRPATLLAQLALELQDRVTVQGADGYVERIEHKLAAGGVDLQTTVYVTKVPSLHVFSFGFSKFAAAGDLTADYIAA